MKTYIIKCIFLIVLVPTILSCKKEAEGFTHNPSSAIVVHEFFPKQGGGGTEILINGENFSSDTSQISVSVDNIPLKIIASNGKQIMAVVPKRGGTGPITVSIAGNSGVSEANYNYLYTRTVTTLAGNGTAGFANGKGTDAQFNFSGESWFRASGIVVDDDLNVYVTDVGNHCIRKIDPEGNVSTLAGSPSSAGYADGQGGQAQFSIPYGLSIDGDGNLYSVDPGNWDVRKITPQGLATTIHLTRVEPWAITVDKKSGNIYYLSCNSPTSVYQLKTDGSTEEVITGLNYPSAIACDDQGDLYITVHGDSQIRKYQASNWQGSVIAGSGAVGLVNGPGASAAFAYPWGMSIDLNNNLYIAGNGTAGGDTNSPDQSIRMVESDSYAVTTFAGSNVAGNIDGIAAGAAFSVPSGVTVDKNGTVYVMDKNNNSVRKIISE